MIIFEDLELSNIERKHSGWSWEKCFFLMGWRHQKYKSHVETKSLENFLGYFRQEKKSSISKLSVSYKRYKCKSDQRNTDKGPASQYQIWSLEMHLVTMAVNLGFPVRSKKYYLEFQIMSLNFGKICLSCQPRADKELQLMNSKEVENVLIENYF